MPIRIADIVTPPNEISLPATFFLDAFGYDGSGLTIFYPYVRSMMRDGIVDEDGDNCFITFMPIKEGRIGDQTNCNEILARGLIAWHKHTQNIDYNGYFLLGVYANHVFHDNMVKTLNHFGAMVLKDRFKPAEKMIITGLPSTTSGKLFTRIKNHEVIDCDCDDLVVTYSDLKHFGLIPDENNKKYKFKPTSASYNEDTDETDYDQVPAEITVNTIIKSFMIVKVPNIYLWNTLTAFTVGIGLKAGCFINPKKPFDQGLEKLGPLMKNRSHDIQALQRLKNFLEYMKKTKDIVKLEDYLVELVLNKKGQDWQNWGWNNVDRVKNDFINSIRTNGRVNSEQMKELTKFFTLSFISTFITKQTKQKIINSLVAQKNAIIANINAVSRQLNVPVPNSPEA